MYRPLSNIHVLRGTSTSCTSDVRADTCSSVIARLGLLSRSTTYIHVSVLHYSTTVHPWTYAVSVFPPSMVVVCHGRKDKQANIECHLERM